MLLHVSARMSLHEAMRAKDEIVEGKTIEVVVPLDEVSGFVAEARSYGFRCAFVGEPYNRSDAG